VRKFLLLSIVFATIFIPLLAARDRSATRALKKTVLMTIGFALFYLFALRILYSYLPP